MDHVHKRLAQLQRIRLAPDTTPEQLEKIVGLERKYHHQRQFHKHIDAYKAKKAENYHGHLQHHIKKYGWNTPHMNHNLLERTYQSHKAMYPRNTMANLAYVHVKKSLTQPHTNRCSATGVHEAVKTVERAAENIARNSGRPGAQMVIASRAKRAAHVVLACVQAYATREAAYLIVRLLESHMAI